MNSYLEHKCCVVREYSIVVCGFHITSGSNRAMVGTWCGGRWTRDEFKLRAVHPTRKIPGVLCEKRKAEE